ncbi:hypothetical protein M8C21_032347 [Ambrosia artemisiifolia]|uniref:Erythronate-4-phosphate dehydrogenase family protein n=1 Tax=Ambrosia artemisiifolia TaxID=4212 RepID=A0AAD5GDY8_AMBAR|nr:hypothetical protein M8C21_032347 [Ambrosia artemisiifolia]
MGLHLLEKTMDTPTHLENGFNGPTHKSYYQPGPKSSLAWLDLRVFYIRISKCDINNESTPEYLTLNHVPLNRDTLLEVNGARTSIYSDGVTTLLRRDRIDKKSEEVTFVSTESVRTTGSVKFEVFDKDALLVSGVFYLGHSNGVHGESNNCFVSKWRMECETDMVVGHGFLKGKHNMGIELDPPSIEDQDYSHYKPEHEHHNHYPRMEYYENEDGELSWFNAGVRVGVGIGLSVCLGVGIGVGLLARTYHRTRRLL